MSLKDLLVHVDASPQGLARLRLAADLAEAHQAYVTGLFLKAPPSPPSALAVGAGAYIGIPDLDEDSRLTGAVERAADSCEVAFRRELERTAAKGEWQAIDAASLRAIVPYAGCADLVILGKVAPVPYGDTTDLPGEIALACGRPVLVVPDRPFASVGERIMIAWNGRRESIRALHDAMPLLECARFVVLLEIGDRDAGPAALKGIAEHLARHGVNAERRVVTASSAEDAGQALLSQADNLDCDLVVMGAYGHTRLREIFLGGATRTVLGGMTFPILMSH